ncbi:MAG: DMT family transporter [Defluviicoccus sp.]|nr:DMT family transporter [Defluviicoccus sp.]MDE0385322.1 DMT family transporter [Defluviicoccus sp.]
MPNWHRSTAIAYAAVLLGVFGHASSEFVAVLTALPGPEAAVWRFGLGGLGLVVLALCFPASRDLLTPLRRDGRRLSAIAFLGVTLPYIAFHWSLDFATVPQVATLITGIPIFVALLAATVDRERVSRARMATGALAMAGVAALLTDGYLAELAGARHNLFGVLLVTVSAAGAAAYVVAIRPLALAYGALRVTAITMALGGIGAWLAVGAFWGRWVDPAAIAVLPRASVAAILAMALFNTTITQFVWIGGLAALPDMTRGAYLFFLKPVIAAALAVAFLGTSLSALQIAAAVFICSTVLVEIAWPRLTRFARGRASGRSRPQAPPPR